MVNGRNTPLACGANTCDVRDIVTAKTVQVGQNAKKGQWQQVERGRRTRWVDQQASQARRESLAQKLTLDTVAPSMDVHAALFKDLLAFQIAR